MGREGEREMWRKREGERGRERERGERTEAGKKGGRASIPSTHMVVGGERKWDNTIPSLPNSHTFSRKGPMT